MYIYNNITIAMSCVIPQDSIKIILVGESNTGKTSIINRFCYDVFHDQTQVTLGCSGSSKILELSPKKIVNLTIWDTAGQEAYRSINKIFYKNAKIVILVYDITCKKTFDEIGDFWLNEVKEFADEDAGK